MFREFFRPSLTLSKALPTYDTIEFSNLPFYWSFLQFVEGRNNFFEVVISLKIHRDFGKHI